MPHRYELEIQAQAISSGVCAIRPQNSNLQISLHYDVGEKPLTYVLSQTMTVFDDTIPEHVQRAIDATKKAGGYVTITRITYEEITG